MQLNMEWNRPIPLKDEKHHKVSYFYEIDLDKVPHGPGIYLLCRRYAGGFEALYVGKATNLRGRIKGQLNNLRLMQHLRNAKAGKRVLLCGHVVTKPGQRVEKCLPLIERALIRYFLSEGFDLVNKQGTRIRRHEVISRGKVPKRFIPSLMFLERAKGD